MGRGRVKRDEVKSWKGKNVDKEEVKQIRRKCKEWGNGKEMGD